MLRNRGKWHDTPDSEAALLCFKLGLEHNRKKLWLFNIIVTSIFRNATYPDINVQLWLNLGQVRCYWLSYDSLEPKPTGFEAKQIILDVLSWLS